MKLDNHIVYKALTNPTDFTIEILEAFTGGKIDMDNLDKYDDIIHALTLTNNKTYYVTKSVEDKLELLDTKRCMQAEGWKIFIGLADFKKTYILPEMEPSYAKYGGSGFVRIVKNGNILQFIHVSAKFLPPKERQPGLDSYMYTVILYINLEEGEMCSHFNSEDGKSLAPFLYSLMCFVELCKNEIIVVEPKGKYGTRKEGKLINILPFPVIIINNTWNVTKILQGTIWVSGHAQIYWTGPGRKIPELIYKEPFTKDGYTIKSGKELNEK